MYFVDLEKAFDIVGMGNEEERSTKILVRSVISLYEGAKTRVI